MKIDTAIVIIVCMIILYNIMHELDAEIDVAVAKLNKMPMCAKDVIIETTIERRLLQRELHKSRTSKVYRIATTAFITAFLISHLNGQSLEATIKNSGVSFIVAGTIGVIQNIIDIKSL